MQTFWKYSGSLLQGNPYNTKSIQILKWIESLATDCFPKLFFNPHILNKTLKIQFNRIKHQIYLALTTRILRKSQMMNYQKVKTEPKAIAGISRSFNPAASVQTCQSSLEGRKQNKTQELHWNQVLIRSCSSCSVKLLNTEIPSQRFAAEAKYEPYKETEVRRHLFCSILSDTQQ